MDRQGGEATEETDSENFDEADIDDGEGVLLFSYLVCNYYRFC